MKSELAIQLKRELAIQLELIREFQTFEDFQQMLNPKSQAWAPG